MKKIFQTAVILIGTLSWWGFVYPELCLTEDACGQEAEAEEAGEICDSQRAEGTGKAAWTEETGKTAWEEETGKTAGTEETGKAAAQEGQSMESSFWETGFKTGGLCIKSRAAEYVYQVSGRKRQKRD